MIRVALPHHLRNLAKVDKEVEIEVTGTLSASSLLDALEERYPVLRGTIRDRTTKQRRAYVRFYACERDLSHEPADHPLPDEVASGAEPFLIVGAMSGG